MLLKVAALVNARLTTAPKSSKNKSSKNKSRPHEPEMHQIKKKNQQHFRLKAHIDADAQSRRLHGTDKLHQAWTGSPHRVGKRRVKRCVCTTGTGGSQYLPLPDHQGLSANARQSMFAVRLRTNSHAYPSEILCVGSYACVAAGLCEAGSNPDEEIVAPLPFTI